MGTENGSPLERPKEAAEELLRGVGLLDVIVGGAYLYLGRLISPPSVPSLFPSTGMDWADIALIIAFASALGILNSFPVAVMLAVGRKLARSDAAALAMALAQYKTVLKGQITPEDHDDDLACAVVLVKSPAAYQSALEIRTRARASYAFAGVGGTFVLYGFIHGIHPFIVAASVGGLLGLLFIGHMRQRDFLRSLRLSLLLIT
jgi:hypothetical protein